MQLWLGEVPPYTVTYVRCTIFLSLTYASFETIRTAVYATGNITRFMVWPEAIYLLVLPISYFAGIMTRNPNALIMAMVIYEIFVCILRIWLATKVSLVTIRGFLSKVFSPCFIVLILDVVTCYIYAVHTSLTIIGLVEMLCFNSISLCVIIVAAGLTRQEKKLLMGIVKSRIRIKLR